MKKSSGPKTTLAQNAAIQNAYITLQNESGIKVGDIVKVLRKARDYEMGWTNSWESDMDYTVGKTYEVESINHSSGITLVGTGRYVPFFVLEKVKPVIPTVRMVKCDYGTVSLEYMPDGDTVKMLATDYVLYVSDLERITKAAKEFLEEHRDNK